MLKSRQSGYILSFNKRKKGKFTVELFARYFLWLITYSFLGWLYESILCSVSQKKLVNRGFLNGPVCPVYGFGAILVIIVLGRETQSTIGLFLSGAVLTCTLEYITSWAMEKLFNARWWDYSNRKFQINGRVCLEGAVVFGLFATVLIKYIHPAVSSFYDRHFNLYQQIFISGGMMSLFIADIVVTVRHIMILNGRLEKIQVYIEKKGKETLLKLEQVGNLGADMRTKLNTELESIRPKVNVKFQDRRLLNAFPNLKSTKYTEALESLREIKEKRAAKKRAK